ncbi:psychosine receptor [Terrapene carolina triunguis]|uniref:G-protein coupled receptor 65 n=1 Tax=Terrapene triunguis TaxID=2587831 RepID=A0A674JXT7_9SAUR|nr:psychosine receptor [Terrapene carolina triunguis]
MNSTECMDDYNLDKNLFPFVYITVIVVSIPVNCTFLCVSCIQVREKNELAIYLFSLSLADLLYTLTLPLWIDYTWREDTWQFSALLCQISAFLMYMNFYTSAAFLTCISVDRYLALVHPLKFQHLRTRRSALLVSIFVWVLETSLNSMILVKDETFHKVCNSTDHLLCYDKYPLEKWQAILNIFRICSGYMIPLAIMLFCNQKIYQAVRHNQATEDREKKKIKKLLLSIIITFFFCFTPYHAVLLIRSINEPDNDNFIHMFKPYRITQALTSFNCIADPILYCFVSETGRTDILNMLKRCFCVRQSELQQPTDATMTSIMKKNTTVVTLKSSTDL